MTSCSRTGVCGCRGVRRCLLCEGEAARSAKRDETDKPSLYFCHNCGDVRSSLKCREDPASSPLLVCKERCIVPTAAVLRCRARPALTHGTTPPFDGVTVVKEFMSREEEAAILSTVDSHTWRDSQSGRRKQDYGPKVNFKRQKLKLGAFSGLPPFIEPLITRMKEEVEVLADFFPVELCNLDYRPERGAHIEAHLDDSWVWGERLVTLNLCSPTLLTFSLPTPHPPPNTLHPHLPPTPQPHPPQDTLHHPNPKIHVPLPPRSLVVVQGHARHLWLHSIERRNIIQRRVGITLRELTNEFLPGGDSEEIGRHLLDIAQQFTGEPTNL